MTESEAKSSFELSLVQAFGLSLVLHLVLFVGLDLMGGWNLFGESRLREAVAESIAAEAERAEPVEFEFQLEPEVLPEMFVDADPTQETEEKPEETPFYAVIDAVAGDQNEEDSLNQPEIDGTQEQVRKTMDTPFPVEPTVSLAQPAPEVETPTPPEEQPAELLNPTLAEEVVVDAEGEDDKQVEEGESEMPPEEVAVMRPTEPADKPIELDDSQNAEPRPPASSRPRTLAEARRQNGMVGQKMKQEGGVKRYRLQSTPNLLATPFGDYDSRVIQAIQQRWFDILGSMPTARNARGRVVLKFNMRSDGSIDGLEVEEDSVGVIQSLVCQKAVSEPAPFGRWPDDMRRMIGQDYREVRFSFFYN